MNPLKRADVLIFGLLLVNAIQTQRTSQAAKGFNSNSPGEYYRQSIQHNHNQNHELNESSFGTWHIIALSGAFICLCFVCQRCQSCRNRHQSPRSENNSVYLSEEQLDQPRLEFKTQDERKFDDTKDQIVAAINASGETESFTYKQSGTTYAIKGKFTSLNKIHPLHYKIELVGEDERGIWAGQGVIIDHYYHGFKFRFTKLYQKLKTKTPSKSNQIYQSTFIHETMILGKWYYQGYRNSLENCGTWQLNLVQNGPVSVLADNKWGMKSQRSYEPSEDSIIKTDKNRRVMEEEVSEIMSHR